MKFTVATKPLADSLSLAIINSNVTQYYAKSCVVQLTAEGNSLRINVEARSVCSEIKLKGRSDSDGVGSAFVSSTQFKQPVSTFEDAVTTLEFVQGGVVLYSGKSKFTLPNLVEADEMTLNRPADRPADTTEARVINKADWKFIKDNQMYAVAMSFTMPVYTRVWVSESGDVLTGDFDVGLFTHSMKGGLDSTCLLPDTIINLFTSLPDDSKIISIGQSYLILVSTDGFEFASEFTPDYEDVVGSYNADIILSIITHSDAGSIKVDVDVLNKFLGQAEMIVTDTDAQVSFDVADGVLHIHDSHVNCELPVGITPQAYALEFGLKDLKSVFSNYSGTVSVCPTYSDEDESVVGILVWDDNLTTALAAAD